MGEFIAVQIDPGKCSGLKACGKCLSACPVNIFDKTGGDDRPKVNQDNEDECILCDLCLNVCAPEAITIRRLYES